MEFIALVIVVAYFSLAGSNPVAGIWDPKCFYMKDGECPNKNVTFWLYTNETQDAPQQLDPINLSPWDFQPRRPVKIIIHGYTGNRNVPPNTQIRPALLATEDVYVISVDYAPLVPEPCYYWSVRNVPFISKCLGQLINNLVHRGIVANEDLHLIGFSLGAQVAGQTSNYVTQKLTRITGLDPAKPLFITADAKGQLDATDADYVDVIHTDILGRGMLHALGHVDFYPNLGRYQPGCQNDDDPSSCNHGRAPEFYAESITTLQGFWAYSCPSWIYHVFGMCEKKENSALMGYFVDKSSRGSFFLSTASTPPFALGRYSENADVSDLSEPETDLADYNLHNIHYDDFEPQLVSAFDKQGRKLSF